MPCCPRGLTLSLLMLAACGPAVDAPATDAPAETASAEAESSSAQAPGGGEPMPRATAIDARPAGGTHGAAWRLADEDSPYLRQHADNAVEWWPWGEAAFAEARARDVPIFLSIGYSSCHWCHVMEHESFEDPEIGAYLAEHFVSIKVDREQRPDVDALMMHRVRSVMRVGGGWPLTAFLTHDADVFFGGTYFPPEARFGQPAFRQVLEDVQRAWNEDRDDVLRNMAANRPLLDADRHPEPSTYDAAALLEQATSAMLAGLDPETGGRGRADGPRFPPSLALQFLLQRQRSGAPVSLPHLQLTLDAMAEKGLFDHVAGGFYRYTVDPRWEIPHFEKMLYDNAQLAPVYAEAAALTGEARYAEVARRTLGWLLSDMRTPEGLFFTARDADSLPFDEHAQPLPDVHPEEGFVYTWTPTELVAVLGEDDGRRFAQLCGVTELGNFEGGRSHLIPDRSPEELSSAPGLDWPEGADPQAWWADALERLRVARDQRPQAFRDEKALAGWNGLALSGLARCAYWLEDEALGAEAGRSAEVLIARLVARDEDLGPRVLHQLFEGRASGRGDLFDHAAVALGVLDAAEVSGRADLRERALELARGLLDRFADEAGGFWLTEAGDPLLGVRGRSVSDGARPAAESLALQVLIRLNAHDRTGRFVRQEALSLERSAELVRRSPGAYASLLVAYDLAYPER